MGHDGNHERTSISITEGRGVTESEVKFICLFRDSHYVFYMNFIFQAVISKTSRLTDSSVKVSVPKYRFNTITLNTTRDSLEKNSITPQLKDQPLKWLSAFNVDHTRSRLPIWLESQAKGFHILKL